MPEVLSTDRGRRPRAALKTKGTVTDLIVTCYCVTYVIVTSDQYLFVFLLYPCELSVLFFIRCKIRGLVACQVHERIDLKDRYDY